MMMVKMFMMLALAGCSMARRTDLGKVTGIVREAQGGPKSSSQGSASGFRVSSKRGNVVGQLKASGISIAASEGVSIVRVDKDSVVGEALKAREDEKFHGQTALKMDIAFVSGSTALQSDAETKIEAFAEDIGAEMEHLRAEHDNCNGECAFVLCSYAGTSTPEKAALKGPGNSGVTVKGAGDEAPCAGHEKARYSEKWPQYITAKCFQQKRGEELRGKLKPHEAANAGLTVDDTTSNYFESQQFATLLLKAFEGVAPATPCSEGDVTPPNSAGSVVAPPVQSSSVREPSVKASSKQSGVERESEAANQYDQLLALLGPGEGSITGLPGMNGNGGEMDVVY